MKLSLKSVQIFFNKKQVFFTQRRFMKDLSRVSHSQIEVAERNYLKYNEQIKKVKYPVQAISAAENLQNKIHSFKSAKVKTQLQKLLEGLNSYRQVRGDGNCFFRAVAFAYLAHRKSKSFKKCFHMIDEISLTSCFQQTIPKDFKKFYEHEFLKTVLEHNWENFYQEELKYSGNLYMKALLRVIDKFPFIDFIIILYFRALCLKSLHKFKNQVQDFLDGSEEITIRKYCEESEGIILDLCSRMLQIETNVYEIRENNVSKYTYSNSNSITQIHLLFYENHYDIIEINENIDSEKSVLKKDEEYFSEVNSQQIQGKCFECQNEGHVYEENGLCAKCFEASVHNLHNFKKQKFVKGFCNQCFRRKNQISDLYGLCKECIDVQNQYQKKKEIVGSQYEKKKKETEPKYQKGTCLQCGFKQLLFVDLQLCKGCKQYQEKFQQKQSLVKKNSQSHQQVRQKQERKFKSSILEEKKDNWVEKSSVKPVSEIKENKKQSEKESQKVKRGRCLHCSEIETIDEATRYCAQCSKIKTNYYAQSSIQEVKETSQSTSSFNYKKTDIKASSNIYTTQKSKNTQKIQSEIRPPKEETNEIIRCPKCKQKFPKKTDSNYVRNLCPFCGTRLYQKQARQIEKRCKVCSKTLAPSEDKYCRDCGRCKKCGRQKRLYSYRLCIACG